MCSGFVLFFPSRLLRESERSVKRVVKRVVVFPNTSPGREESPASRPPSLGQGQNPSHITSRTSLCPDSTAVPAMRDLPLARNAPCVEDGKKKKKHTKKWHLVARPAPRGACRESCRRWQRVAGRLLASHSQSLPRSLEAAAERCVGWRQGWEPGGAVKSSELYF